MIQGWVERELDGARLSHDLDAQQRILNEYAISLEKEEKQVTVKEEKSPDHGDDFNDNNDFLDDDNDDELDDQPLMNLATKVPKKESVDVFDLLDNAKPLVKRKSTTKAKTTSSKKAKIKETKTKPKEKPEKKKKAATNDPRNNAEIILKETTAFPFKLNDKCVLCLFCHDQFEDPEEFRRHMRVEHEKFNLKVAFNSVPKPEFIKVDISNLNCRTCAETFDSLENVATHLKEIHGKQIDWEAKLGVIPYRLQLDVYICVICQKTVPSLLHLNRHTVTHFWTHVCHVCGKRYVASTGLLKHVRSIHQQYEVSCRSCGKVFPSYSEKDKHRRRSKECMIYRCTHCPERFNDWKSRKQHMEAEHGLSKRSNRCVECNIDFGSGIAYYEHFRLRHSSDCLTLVRRLVVARNNAKVVLKYTTACPFRIPSNSMVCVYCCESYDDPDEYRAHMADEHKTYNVHTAFAHTLSNFNEYLKVDCTDLRCRLCLAAFDGIQDVARHLKVEHNKEIDTDVDVAMQMFRLGTERWLCAFCDMKYPTLRELSRHTASHYHKYTCEICGKSYINPDNLKKHLKYGHSALKICVKCKECFPSVEAKREHSLTSEKCWPLACSHCNQRFRSNNVKRAHITEVHGEAPKVYKCPECVLVFDRWRPYRTHFILTHTNDTISCPHCKQRFDTKRSLSEHVVTHTQEKSFSCDVCLKTFARKKNLIQHSWIHNEYKRFGCKLCKLCNSYVVAKRNAELLVQSSTVYPFRLPEESMVCVYCCEKVEEPSKYRQHMVDEHPTFNSRMAFAHVTEGFIKADCSELQCRLCPMAFDTLETIAQHLVDVHDKDIDLNHDLGIQPFKLQSDKLSCALCNAKAICLRQLSRHTQTHFTKYTCEACGKSYSTCTSLKHHITFSHSGGNRVCRKCKKTFETLEEKRQHVSKSKKCWSHLCNVCGERFFNWTNKNNHLFEVHGVTRKNYVCPECSLVFVDRKKYRAHFKLSHTEDVYICTCCGLKFETKKHLDEHRVIHTKEKPFPCPVCTKSFARKKNLIQHLWIHSELKRFSCTLCSKQFNQRVTWKTHMRSYHPEIENFERAKLEIRGGSESKKVILVYRTPQRHNTELILKYSTAYPFKMRFSQILCAYCHDEFNTLSNLRFHTKDEHIDSDYNNVFYRAKDNLVKIDITDLACKLCDQEIQNVDALMGHLSREHNKTVKFNVSFGVLPYKQNSQGYYLCVYCQKVYKEFIHFNRHINTHFMNFSCEKCGTAFISDHSLKDHLRQVKCFRTAYKPRNGRSLNYRNNAEIVIQYSTACPFRTWMSNFNCIFCRVQTNNPCNLRLHVASQHENYDVRTAFYKKLGKEFLKIDITDLQCKLCFMSIENIEDLTYHLKNDHQQPLNMDAQMGVLPFRLNDGTKWKCTICPNEFKDFVSLKKHTAEHFQNYVCDTCGEGFITESAMVAHTKVPHENKYTCSRCVATFSSLQERNIHVKTQHTSTPYMCVYCKEKPRFANWELRRKHLTDVHNYKTGTDKYECLTCQKTFKTRSGRYNHMARIHRMKKDSELNYQCHRCPKAFTTQLFLDKHVAKKHYDL
ncbi:unnamed protein product [Leptidea sinapis]|uniref:C2H2-type domain-containing protein n=1 Tax=Leptidea sinapis TaxID=189913 RepID=A0A5E4R537_9NEOP|nr:unnamed protein product [Leptidea sinapis]